MEGFKSRTGEDVRITMAEWRGMLFFYSPNLFSLLLLLLSVCDDVADVLVVYVASHIRGESSPQVGHLVSTEKQTLRTGRHEPAVHRSFEDVEQHSDM